MTWSNLCFRRGDCDYSEDILKRRGWQKENKTHKLAMRAYTKAVMIEKEQVICHLLTLMVEGRLTELVDGMSKGEKYLIITIVINLNSLPKLHLQCDLLNHGIKLKMEPI